MLNSFLFFFGFLIEDESSDLELDLTWNDIRCNPCLTIGHLEKNLFGFEVATLGASVEMPRPHTVDR